MYALLRQTPLRSLLLVQTPAFLISFVIAEFFYKFHSFALECAAFVVTWFVIDFVISTARAAWLRRGGRDAPTA